MSVYAVLSRKPVPGTPAPEVAVAPVRLERTVRFQRPVIDQKQIPVYLGPPVPIPPRLLDGQVTPSLPPDITFEPPQIQPIKATVVPEPEPVIFAQPVVEPLPVPEPLPVLETDVSRITTLRRQTLFMV